MPNGAPSVSSCSITSTADMRLAVECRRAGPSRSGWCAAPARCGFVNASFDSTQAVSGMLPSEVSVSLPPMVTPHRPRLMEYAAPNGGTGRLRACRYSSSSWRLKALSRTGAITSSSGASVRSATSKRTWSLPAAVQPCAMELVPSLRAMQRDGLRLHDALGAHAQRIELAAAHVAHDQETQHLLEVVGARVDLVMLDGAQRQRALVAASSRRRRRCRRCPR